ncbi:MAG TPA: cytochrome C, partial [Bryobacterales bacterium]|nr:cytochrome C [Bryobacterales bacterium]
DDEDAFWGNYDLARAIARGMKDNGIPYSGKYGFIETWSWWPINHMVAPKEKAVQCDECHTRDNGRLANLAGFYMPGRDRWWWLDALGWLAIFGSLALVIVHTIARIVMKGRYGAEGGAKE